MKVATWLLILATSFVAVGCQSGKSIVRLLENTQWKSGTLQQVLARYRDIEAIYLAGDPYPKFDLNDIEIGFESPNRVQEIINALKIAKHAKHEELRGQTLAFRFNDGTGIHVVALPDDRGFIYGPNYESPELYKRFEKMGLITKYGD